MRRLYLIILTFVVLIGVLAWAFFNMQRGYKTQAPSPQAEQITRDLLTKPYTEETAAYSISAAYPTTTPFTGKAGEAAIDAMQGWVIEEISRFKDHTASGTHATLAITYTASSTDQVASYLFTVNENGRTSTKTFSFTERKNP